MMSATVIKEDGWPGFSFREVQELRRLKLSFPRARLFGGSGRRRGMI